MLPGTVRVPTKISNPVKTWLPLNCSKSLGQLHRADPSTAALPKAPGNWNWGAGGGAAYCFCHHGWRSPQHSSFSPSGHMAGSSFKTPRTRTPPGLSPPPLSLSPTSSDEGDAESSRGLSVGGTQHLSTSHTGPGHPQPEPLSLPLHSR